ncbi:MAG: TPM domain-containing protein [Candidatus Aenigmarchaeota archaeon]|nr:TPM domain-containing protein [Candidatus Aenigmarchaeota archaeon]
MKRIISLIVLFLLLSLQTYSIPSYKGFVNDYANVISNNYEVLINNYLLELKKNTSAEVVILTVNDTESYTPKEYATLVFNTWGIGKKEKDNGLLILVSMKDRRIEVETGYGLEGILPDSKVGRILDENVIPFLKQGNYDEGLYRAVISFGEVIMKGKSEIYVEDNENIQKFYIFFAFFIILIFFNFFRTILKVPKCPYDKTKMKLILTRTERTTGFFPQEFYIEVYKCPKCGYGLERREKRRKHIFIIGGIGGTGGVFGGFGGGRSGGGGAGRGF